MKKRLDFASSISKEDVKYSTDVLVGYGFDVIKAYSILKNICLTFFGVNINEMGADGSLWFSVLLNGEEIEKCENILEEQGFSVDDAKIVLQELCHILVDLEIYDAESEVYSVW